MVTSHCDGHELRDVSGGWLVSLHVTTAHVTRGASAAVRARAWLHMELVLWLVGA